MAIIYKQPYAKYVPKYENAPANKRISKKQHKRNMARVRALADELFGVKPEE